MPVSARLTLTQVAPLWWCKSPDVGIPAPDVVFYLKLPATIAETRKVFGSERYEQVPFQQEVEKQFESLRDNDWVELDASQDIDALHSEILMKTNKIVQQCAHRPIGKLWEADSLCSS